MLACLDSRSQCERSICPRRFSAPPQSQACLSLALNSRLADEHRNHADRARHHIVAGNRRRVWLGPRARRGPSNHATAHCANLIMRAAVRCRIVLPGKRSRRCCRPRYRPFTRAMRACRRCAGKCRDAPASRRPSERRDNLQALGEMERCFFQHPSAA